MSLADFDHTRPLSVRMFLLDNATDTVEALTRSFSECSVAQSAIQGIRKLPASALQTVNREIATVADELVNLDLGNLLVSGWRKYTELTEAAKRTLATPDSKEVVFLATHSVASTHHPSIELLVDGVKIHTFIFELTVVFDLNGVETVLQQGALVALRGGECVVTATLTLEGTSLKLSREGRIDLPLLVQLHRPIPLTRRDPHPSTSHLDRSAP